ASKEAANMANIIAAAAKVGKVEVPGLSDALTRSGAEASAAGVGFMDLNAALEVAGKFFGSTERLGTAMRGVMTTIGSGVVPKEVAEQMESYGVNMAIVTDKSLSLKERLTELQKIAGDQGLMEKVFGAGETTAGRGLLMNLDLLDKYKTEMMGMPDALKQMSDTMNDTYEKSTEKIRNFFSNIRQSVFEMTGDALPALDIIGSGLSDIIMLAPGIMAMKQAIDAMRESEKIAAFWTNILSSATWKWTAALLANPLTWVIAAVAALVAGVIYAWNNFEGFRAAIYGLWETFKQVFTNIADFFKKMLAPIFEAIELFRKGDYAGAAAAAAKGALNLVTLPMQAATALVKGEFTKGVGEAYNKGAEAGRNSFAESKKGETPETVLPGTTESKPMLPGNNPDVALKQSQGASKAEGGGGRIITVHINQLVGTIQNHIAGAQADMTKIREAVKEALVAGVRDFELSGN
ncbi:MAG: phage tail tape measure protein, partial [Bacteroidia bacterium]